MLKKELKGNDQFDVTTLVIFGSWIEALYITTATFDPTKNVTELRKAIASQKSQLSKILHYDNENFPTSINNSPKDICTLGHSESILDIDMIVDFYCRIFWQPRIFLLVFLFLIPVGN